MKRRDFLTKLGAASAAAALSPLTFSRAQDRRIRLEMVTSWPTSLDLVQGGAEEVARLTNELTGGDVVIDVYPAGAQIGALEVHDAVSLGAFQLGHTASYYYVGKDPAHGFFTSVPFGMNAQQMSAWMRGGRGQEWFDALNARDDLIAFPAGNTGAQMGGWFNRELGGPSDLAGLTMRIPGLGGQVMNRVGVNVQNIPPGEIFLTLETGVIDAAEWVGPYDDEILGLDRIARYYYGPSWHEPGPMVSTYVHLPTWSELPSNVQAALRAASALAGDRMLGAFEARNAPALDRLAANGTQVRTFSPEILATLSEAMTAIHAENASDPFYADVLEDYQAFQERTMAWHAASEYAMDTFLQTE